MVNNVGFLWCRTDRATTAWTQVGGFRSAIRHSLLYLQGATSIIRTATEASTNFRSPQ